MLGNIICKDKPQFAVYLLMDIWAVPSFGLLQVKLLIIPYSSFKSCTVSLCKILSWDPQTKLSALVLLSHKLLLSIVVLRVIFTCGICASTVRLCAPTEQDTVSLVRRHRHTCTRLGTCNTWAQIYAGSKLGFPDKCSCEEPWVPSPLRERSWQCWLKAHIYAETPVSRSAGEMTLLPSTKPVRSSHFC